jgi:hypothetical protein
MSAVTRCFIATSLAAVIAAGVPTLLFAQQLGTISGTADDEADKPFDNYSVQLMDLTTKQIAATVPLDTQGRFSFTGVAPDKQYQVQLFHLKENRVVCTEGPYSIVGPNMLTRTDVDIDCDKPPAIIWWAAAAAGLAATIALVNGDDCTPPTVP